MNTEQVQKEIRSVDRKIEFEKGKIVRINQIIDTIRGNIDQLDIQKRQLKKKLTLIGKDKKLPNGCEISFDGFWPQIMESGIDKRDIFILQNDDLKPAQLGRLLGITTGRAYQLKQHAIRKMRHPHRIEIIGDHYEDIEYAHHVRDFNQLIEEQDAKDKIVLMA
jgi:hypothetical protein